MAAPGTPKLALVSNLGGRQNAKRMFQNAINTHESKTPKRQTPKRHQNHDQQNAKTPQNAKRQNA